MEDRPHSGEEWAMEAGEVPDLAWCHRCHEWVEFDTERDEDGLMWLRFCLTCGGHHLSDRDDLERGLDSV